MTWPFYMPRRCRRTSDSYWGSCTILFNFPGGSLNALLAIVLLSHQGYWVAGTQQTVNVRSVLVDPAKAGMPAADWVWDLALGNVSLAHGKLGIDQTGQEVELKVVCPQVRTRISLVLSWRLLGRADGRELAAGTAKVQAFPADLTDAWPRIMRGHALVVVDPEGALSKFLGDAKVPFTRTGGVSALQFERGDMVLVAPGALDGSRFEQSAFLALARSGSGVMIFRQSRVDSLVGLPLAVRAKPARLEWEVDHPLLNRFTCEDLDLWRDGLAAELSVLKLPAQDAWRPLICWPAEAQGGASLAVAGAATGAVNGPATGARGSRVRNLPNALPSAPARLPLSGDALLVIKQMGAGRLVLCQLPLDDWQTDARSQIFLGAALDYLTTRPEISPAASSAGTHPVDAPLTSVQPMKLRGDAPHLSSIAPGDR